MTRSKSSVLPETVGLLESGMTGDCRGRTRSVLESTFRGARHPSEVVGSMIDFISETRLAGKPPAWACSRIISSLGAM